MVGLAGAFGEVFDLLVLYADLLTKKNILAFNSLGVSGRDLSRRVGTCRSVLSWLFVALFGCDICRDRSRHVASSRGRSDLFDVGDVLRDGCWRDERLFTERRLDAPAIKMSFR